MSDKTHGHAPRVRHRQNADKPQTYIQVDEDKVVSTVVSSAIGAVIGTIVTQAINGD